MLTGPACHSRRSWGTCSDASFYLRVKEGVCNRGSSMGAELPMYAQCIAHACDRVRLASTVGGHGGPVVRARALPTRANAPSIHHRSCARAFLHIARGAAKWSASMS
eukprot:2603887-Pyramimonas_sp.AAC.1